MFKKRILGLIYIVLIISSLGCGKNDQGTRVITNKNPKTESLQNTSKEKLLNLY